MKEIKRRAIVKVNAKFTKGNDWFYLVLFNDFRTGFCSCLRVFLGGDRIKNDLLEIPNTYLGTRYMTGYANAFTGLTAIRHTDITEVVSEIPDDMYSRVIRGAMLIFMGMCKIDNPNDAKTCRYRIVDNPIQMVLDSTKLFNLMIGSFNDEPNAEGSTVEVEETEAKDESKKDESNAEESAVEEAKDKPEKDESDTEEPMLQNKRKTKEIIKIGDRVYSEATIKDLKEEYSKLTDTDDRLNNLYNIWSVNGKLPLSQIYNILIKNIDVNTRKTTILVSKEEFAFIMRESYSIIGNADFTDYGGTIHKMNSPSSIKNLKTMCKALYFGLVRNTQNQSKNSYLTKGDIEAIKALIDEGKEKEEILELFDAANKEKRAAAINCINNYMKMTGSILVSNRFEILKKYSNYNQDEELKKIVEYFENNFERIGVVASGIIPNDFLDCDHNKAIMIAIYLNKSQYISYRIIERLGGEYVKNSALGLYTYMIGWPRAMYIHSYMNADKAKSNKRFRQETIYGFLQTNKTKKPYTDKLNVQEQNFISILGIDKRDYIIDRDFVLSNLEKFDNWHKARVRLDKKAKKGES